MVSKTDVVVGALWALAFLLLLFLAGLRLFGQELEPGALWHDGNFAPCGSLFCGEAFITLARDGGGANGALTWYILSLGFRVVDCLDIFGGARINLVTEESLTTSYRARVTETFAWPLIGALFGVRQGTSVAKAGVILTWHGEGWALWPAFFLGFQLKWK